MDDGGPIGAGPVISSLYVPVAPPLRLSLSVAGPATGFLETRLS